VIRNPPGYARIFSPIGGLILYQRFDLTTVVKLFIAAGAAGQSEILNNVAETAQSLSITGRFGF
jgi:hypothetical protein